MAFPRGLRPGRVQGATTSSSSGSSSRSGRTSQLVRDLIPRLYAAGVRNLGIEYALSDDQDRDRLPWSRPLRGTRPGPARSLFTGWSPGGTRNTSTSIKAAWQVNHARPAGAKPFRIVGLNVRQDWEYLKTQKDLEDPAIVARIFANGVPDAHMADVIDREFIHDGREGPHLLRDAAHLHPVPKQDVREERREHEAGRHTRAGNIVYQRIGGARLLHFPSRALAGRVTEVGSRRTPPTARSTRSSMPFPLTSRTRGGTRRERRWAHCPWGTPRTRMTAGPLPTSSTGTWYRARSAAYTMVTPIKDFVSRAERGARGPRVSRGSSPRRADGGPDEPDDRGRHRRAGQGAGAVQVRSMDGQVLRVRFEDPDLHRRGQAARGCTPRRCVRMKRARSSRW